MRNVAVDNEKETPFLPTRTVHGPATKKEPRTPYFGASQIGKFGVRRHIWPKQGPTGHRHPALSGEIRVQPADIATWYRPKAEEASLREWLHGVQVCRDGLVPRTVRILPSVNQTKSVEKRS